MVVQDLMEEHQTKLEEVEVEQVLLVEVVLIVTQVMEEMVHLLQ